jgi:hypothetical protein
MGAADTITKNCLMLDGDDAPHDQPVVDIVQCRHGDGKTLRIDSSDGGPTTPKCKLLILLALQGCLTSLDNFRDWLGTVELTSPAPTA